METMEIILLVAGGVIFTLSFFIPDKRGASGGKGLSREEMCHLALKGFQVEKLDETKVGYACNCSKERFTRVLLTLPREELETLPVNKDGLVETVCQYCNRKYLFSKEEIQALVEKTRKKGK